MGTEAACGPYLETRIGGSARLCCQPPGLPSRSLRPTLTPKHECRVPRVLKGFLPSFIFFFSPTFAQKQNLSVKKRHGKSVAQVEAHPLHAARGTDVSSPARPAGARAMACGRRDVHAVLCSCMHALTTPQAPSTCCSGACCSFGVRPHHGTGVNGFGRRQDGREPGSSHTGSAHR